MKPLNDILKRLHSLEDNHVEYGYDSTPHNPSDKTLAEIAAIHEYGMLGNPERDFMYQADINNQIDNTVRVMKNTEEYIYYGGSFVNLFTNIGKMGVESIKDSIQGGNFEPNAAMTIRLKGSDRPLIDTGELLNGAKYWVIKEPIK